LLRKVWAVVTWFPRWIPREKPWRWRPFVKGWRTPTLWSFGVAYEIKWSADGLYDFDYMTVELSFGPFWLTVGLRDND